MESNTSPQEVKATAPIKPEDALEETVRMIVSGYLKNNLDKHANPTSKHFAAGLTKSLESGMHLKNPSSREAKITTFLNYINRNERLSGMDEHELRRQDLTTTPLRSLMHELAEDFAIDISDEKKLDVLAQAVHQSEVAVLIKRGQGGDVEQQGMLLWEDLDAETKEKYRTNVKQKAQEQVRSLERWIKYVASDGADYPSWYKYFIIVSLRSMGVEQFELGTYTYGGRDKKKTLFRFPTLNPAVLAKVYDRMLAAYSDENRQKPTPSKYEIQGAFRSSVDEAEQLFLEKYAKEANFAQLYAYELSKYKERTIESKRSSEGIWLKYNQQQEGTQALKEEARRLSDSLLDKGTMWCTEGTNFSESQLASGDFHVYYTREDIDKESYNTSLDDMTDNEKREVCTMPRIAIKMNGNVIGELRGIVGGDEQDLEPEMLDIARTKYQGDPEKREAPLGGYESYEKKTQDMKKLLTLIEKQDKGTFFTRDDIRFLYEVDTKIEGFGHNEDPRIEELRSKRNRSEDVQVLCNCEPQFIAHGFTDINEQTQVYVEDDGKKIILFDFREEKNKEKLQKLLELAQAIKVSGSPARPDMSFEGGIVALKIDQKTLEALRTWNTAKVAYQNTDNQSPSWIWDKLDTIPYTAPKRANLDILVLNHGKTTPQERDKLVEDLDTQGFRPLEFSELVALGILKPEYNKRNEVLNTYKKYSLGGGARVPYLSWGGEMRMLGAGWAVGEWIDGLRFLFVRR
jgi:hypothetical protein